MSNIQQIFRVAMLLTHSASEDFSTFYSNFSKDAQYSAPRHKFYITYGENEWWVCTHSNHLCCETEFDTLEAAQEAEADGFALLADYGYWKEEEEE